MYAEGKCLIYEDENPNIFWGMHKDECDLFALTARRLEKAYRQKMQSSSGTAKRSLRLSQGRWIAAIKQRCGVSLSDAITLGSEADCLREAVERRTKVLSRQRSVSR
jgi:hypothetical protein